MMPGNLLTITSSVMCPHGGQAILFTANADVMVDGAPVLLETDVHPVVACPFTIGLKYSPCVQIRWSGGAARAGINGVPALVQSSIGVCLSPEGAPQGVAVIASIQPKVTAE
jgi:hypothetical protein